MSKLTCGASITSNGSMMTTSISPSLIECLWGNIGIVAILRCVGAGDEERLVLLVPVSSSSGIGLRLDTSVPLAGCSQHR